MSSTSPVRFVVIGCGMIAQGTHIPNIARSSKTSLVGLCDMSADLLAGLAKTYPGVRTFTDYREAIRCPDVEAICLATTEKLRLPVIQLAAEVGKPVYVEKPIARSLDEARAIQRLVHQSGIPFCVGHNRRSSPAMLQAHQIFRDHMRAPKWDAWRFDREGPEGRPNLPDNGVAAMSVRINDDWYTWKKWVFDKEQAPHGPMLFEMSHFTDLCNWFLAAEPEEVIAMETGMLTSGVNIRYRTGEMASICMSANGSFGYPKELYEVMGQGAIVVVDFLVEVRTAGIPNTPMRIPIPMLKDRHPHVGVEGGFSGYMAKLQVACQEAAEAGDPMLQFSAGPDYGHVTHMDRFADQIRARGPEVCGIDDALLATRVCFAAIQSAREKRPVRVEEV